MCVNVRGRADRLGIEGPSSADCPGLPAGLTDEAAAAFGKRRVQRLRARGRAGLSTPWPATAASTRQLAYRSRSTNSGWLDASARSARCAARGRVHRLPRARGIDEAGTGAPPTYLLRRGEYAAQAPRFSRRFRRRSVRAINRPR